jgi:betaine reductase
MAKEFERLGIPTAFVSTIVPLAESIGPNRIIAGRAVTHPLGNPELSPDAEKEFRRGLIRKALDLLQTDTEQQMIVRLEDR